MAGGSGSGAAALGAGAGAGEGTMGFIVASGEGSTREGEGSMGEGVGEGLRVVGNRGAGFWSRAGGV
jgi:hypothetical protein